MYIKSSAMLCYSLVQRNSEFLFKYISFINTDLKPSTVLIKQTLNVLFYTHVFVEIIYWFGNRTTPRDTVPLLCVSFYARLFIILISMDKNWTTYWIWLLPMWTEHVVCSLCPLFPALYMQTTLTYSNWGKQRPGAFTKCKRLNSYLHVIMCMKSGHNLLRSNRINRPLPL